MTKRLIMNNNDNKLNNNYNYIHKPKHYSLFSLEELRSIVAKGESIDVVAIANKAGLDKDAYMFNVLKYVLRQQKPNEPRRRDVEKIREYADIWLKNDKQKSNEQKIFNA